MNKKKITKKVMIEILSMDTFERWMIKYYDYSM